MEMIVVLGILGVYICWKLIKGIVDVCRFIDDKLHDPYDDDDDIFV